MQLKQKVTSLLKKIRQLPVWITIPAAAVLVVFFVCIVIFFQEKTVTFSYSEKSTCVQHLTFLPSISKPTFDNSGFTVENRDILKLGSTQIFSQKTCFSAKKAPSKGDVRISIAPFGGWFAKKTFKLVIPQPPSLKLESLSRPIPIKKPLVINLSSTDTLFKYQIEVGNKSSQCPSKGSDIYCDLSPLHLLQGTKYSVKMARTFNSQRVSTIVSRDIKTLDSTEVVGTSVAQGQFVYDKPKTFSFTFNKDVANSSIILEKIEDSKRTLVASTSSFNAKQANLTVQDNLGRDALYEFTIDQLVAKDGSTLESPYKLSFNVSDGPSVVSVDADATPQPLSQTITLTFDQEILASQDISNFVSTNGIPTTISKSGNKVYINYSDAPMCTDLGIRVSGGLQSSYGVTQNDSWAFSTRTICHSVSSIGYSKEGRPILAYIFGSGSQIILFTGAIHGSELSGKYLMDAWINELEINARDIPSDKTIIVIPSLNPDGVAANRRTNSNNVDLNRNFPTIDWQTDIFTTSNQPFAGGGGSSPLSEPESKAISDYTIKLNPTLTMSFHSSAAYVIGNRAGNSNTLAATYAQMTGYRNMTGDGGAFSYPITGTYDDWMNEKYGLKSVLVELSSSSYSEFSRNKAALWVMARS